MEKLDHNAMRPSNPRALKGCNMKSISVCLLGTALVLLSGNLRAQAAPEQGTTGKIINGYAVENAIEFGGRYASVSGNSDMYGTLENLKSGPRLLDQSLSMRSLDHHGVFFDQLWLTSFGYGGDPQAGSRLRIYKDKLYDFNAVYRHDQNYFNDNYLLNPYNTPGGPIVWNQAIHQMNTRRDMGDFHLTLLPQSPIRIRLGYSRNNNHGFSLSSYHGGTDISLNQDVQSRQDQYQVGIDVKVMPRTILSYDQYYDHNKTDTTYADNPIGNFVLNTGTTLAPVYTPVDLGAIYNTYYGQPCANFPTPIYSVVGGANVVNSPACNMYFGYHRSGPTRANFPTERLSLISDYWKRLNIAATGSYTSAENKTNYLETADGFESRTGTRGYLFTGPGKVRQVSANADLGVTFHLNDAWSISNQLKYTNWRIPGTWNMTDANCGPVGASNILSPIGTLGNPLCGALGSTNVTSASAGAGSALTLNNWSRLYSEKRIADTTLVAFEPTRLFAAHAGFRYARRTSGFGDFTAGTTTTFSAAGVPTTSPSGDDTGGGFFGTADNHEKAGLFGVKLHPRDNWLINGDVELSYIDAPFAAILPGHRQNYRLRSTYRLAKWGTLAGFINNKLSRNNYYSADFALANINTNPLLSGIGSTPTWVASPVNPVRHVDHSLNYGLSASLHPSEKLSIDFGWTYQDIFSTSGTCMPMTLAILPQGGQISRCPAASSSGPLTDVEGDPYSSYNGVPLVLHYQQNTNTGYVNVIVQPVKRLSVLLGYDITSDTGDNTYLRADTFAPFEVPVDASGNVIYAGNTHSGPQVGYALGPNPSVGLGPLALNWHLPSAGVEIGLTRNLAFKGMWRYYNYHEKSNPGIYILPRDFQANTGTLSLRYSF